MTLNADYEANPYQEDERWIREGAEALLKTKDFADRPVLALSTARLLWQLWWRGTVPFDYGDGVARPNWAPPNDRSGTR